MNNFIYSLAEQMQECVIKLAYPEQQMISKIEKERISKEKEVLQQADEHKNHIMKLIIRINDINNILVEFPGFKDDWCYSYLTENEGMAKKFQEELYKPMRAA